MNRSASIDNEAMRQIIRGRASAIKNRHMPEGQKAELAQAERFSRGTERWTRLLHAGGAKRAGSRAISKQGINLGKSMSKDYREAPRSRKIESFYKK